MDVIDRVSKRIGRVRAGRRSQPLPRSSVVRSLPLAIVGAFAATSLCASSADAALARAARSVTVHDEAHLHLIRSSGSLLIDEGAASGTLPGTVLLRFTYDGSPTVGARFTIRGAGWTIEARGQGKLSNPTSPNPSFSGSLTIASGSGRFAHAHGSGELYGVFHRRGYGLTVQAIGKLTY
jgi:hypothetical protein